MDALINVRDFLHSYLVTGALSKGGSWGGAICRTAVPIRTHLYEVIVWLSIAVFAYKYLNVTEKLKTMRREIKVELLINKQGFITRGFDLLMCTVHFAMFAHIIYFKSNIMSLVNMIQPCHMILLIQGLALLSTGPNGVFIAVFVLPALTGTSSAMLFPDTSGLDQPFEMDSYWIQHYIIQVVPLYLLCRRNFLALKFATPFSVFFGLWILLFLHFSLYEAVDLALNVNVEFMLCPTAAMYMIFDMVPSWIIWPSYRTTLTIAVLIIAWPLSYAYIFSASLLRLVFGKSLPAAKETKKTAITKETKKKQ